MKEKKQVFYNDYCKLCKEITTFVTSADEDKTSICSLCGYRKMFKEISTALELNEFMESLNDYNE